MATQGMSPIERLAKGLVKPVAVKQTVPPVPPAPKSAAQQLLEELQSPTTTVAPIKTGGSDPNPPVLPAYSVPANKPFVGPTLDLDVVNARRKLDAEARRAARVGVDPSAIKAITAGEGDPEGFVKPAKFLGSILKKVYSFDIDLGEGTKQPFVGLVNQPLASVPTKSGQYDVKIKSLGPLGVKLLSAATPGLNKLDFGRRLIQSIVKETGDVFNPINDASFKDFKKQLTPEGAKGGGDFFKEGILGVDNPYLNQILGFTADVFLDPITLATGPAGLGKTAATRGALTAGKLGTRGEKILARASAAQAEQYAAALQRKLADEALDFAVSTGDDLAAKAAEEAIKQANDLAAKAAKTLAGDAATRSLGRTANQALAENVLSVRDEAQQVINRYADEFKISPKESITQIQAKGLFPETLDPAGYGTRRGVASLEELANARRVVEVLDDSVIRNIQTSGLAGIAGPYIDILKGTRTAAQDVLGVRGGVRVVNPMQILPKGGVGPQRFVIPGTERILNATGKFVSRSRLNVGRTALGASFLNKITPTGDGGLFGAEDLLDMRTRVRSGRLSGQEATEITRLLQLDQQYRALVNNERKTAAAMLAKAELKPGDAAAYNEVIRIEQTAKFAGLKAALTPEQQIISNKISKIFDDFYDYATKASGGTGYIPAKRADYFPQMQTDKALRWATKNKDEAEKLAKALKVDRTWFVGNFRARELGVGDMFFGKKLDAADIAGGPTTLNNIVRAYGLDFDFFETDVLTAINKYANKHAQFSALQKTIGSLPETLPTAAARRQGKNFVTPRVRSPYLIQDDLSMFYDPATGFPFDSEKVLQQLTTGELKTLLNDVDAIVSKLDAKLVDKQGVVKSIDALKVQLDEIAERYASKTIDEMDAAVASDAVIKEAKTLVDELNGVFLNILSVPATRWSEYAAIVKRGFEILNDSFTDPVTGKFYQGTAPDIAVRYELADLLRNAQRMDDKAFAGSVRLLSQDYTRFAKAWLTGRPGFHTRNALSNTFQLIAAGANPFNLTQGNKILNRINNGIQSGKTIRQIAEDIVGSGLVKVQDEAFNPELSLQSRRQLIEAVEESINYSGATGFGQFGEIAAEVGVGNRGLLQKSAPRNKASQAAGAYLKASRKVGEVIENYSRFGLMWDGIMKGLSPAEAAARANKYLIDYSDLSKLDRNAKLIFPFWTFMSRNTPLQLELMWTNPKAYAFYSNLKRNFEDTRTEEEGGLVIPGYEKDRGVFALKNPINIPGLPESVKNAGKFASAYPGIGPALGLISQFPGIKADVVRPGLPFAGGGDDVIQTVIEEPTKLLASTNPAVRSLVEATINRKFFTSGKVVPRDMIDNPVPEKIKYLSQQIFSPTSTLTAYLRAIPGVSQSKFIEEYLGVNPDDAEPMVQTINSIFSLFGLPIGTQRKESSLRELQNRLYQLGDRIDAIKDREKKAKEDAKTKAAPSSDTPQQKSAAQQLLDDLQSQTTVP